MSMWSRATNLLRRRRLADGVSTKSSPVISPKRSSADAIRSKRGGALGSPLRHREASLDQRLVELPSDALRADVIFGWRELRKTPARCVAAVLSLAIAVGACTAAFRLGIDALLFRPLLPNRDPDALHVVWCSRQGPMADRRARWLLVSALHPFARRRGRPRQGRGGDVRQARQSSPSAPMARWSRSTGSSSRARSRDPRPAAE